MTPCRSARVSHTHVSSNVREWQLGDHKLICIRDKICLKPLSAISFRPLHGTTGSNAAVKSPIWNLVRHWCNVQEFLKNSLLLTSDIFFHFFTRDQTFSRYLKGRSCVSQFAPRQFVSFPETSFYQSIIPTIVLYSKDS